MHTGAQAAAIVARRCAHDGAVVPGIVRRRRASAWGLGPVACPRARPPPRPVPHAGRAPGQVGARHGASRRLEVPVLSWRARQSRVAAASDIYAFDATFLMSQLLKVHMLRRLGPSMHQGPACQPAKFPLDDLGRALARVAPSARTQFGRPFLRSGFEQEGSASLRDGPGSSLGGRTMGHPAGPGVAQRLVLPRVPINRIKCVPPRYLEGLVPKVEQKIFPNGQRHVRAPRYPHAVRRSMPPACLTGS